MDLHQNFIGGRFEDVSGGDRIPVLNPARDTVISEIPDSPPPAVDQAVAAAKKAQRAWEKLPAIQRAGYLRQISAKIDHRHLPAYSPDLNPIEPCWSKLKTRLRARAARTLDALEAELAPALATITSQDAHGWFRLCAYPPPN